MNYFKRLCTASCISFFFSCSGESKEKTPFEWDRSARNKPIEKFGGLRLEVSANQVGEAYRVTFFPYYGPSIDDFSPDDGRIDWSGRAVFPPRLVRLEYMDQNNNWVELRLEEARNGGFFVRFKHEIRGVDSSTSRFVLVFTKTPSSGFAGEIIVPFKQVDWR